jgi:hypothetical protein
LPERRPTLTPSVVLGEADRILRASGYDLAETSIDDALRKGHARLGEDPYCVVMVAAYENWPELEKGWEETQGALVDIISGKLSRSDPKSWEGFLVLFCPFPLTRDEKRSADSIRYDTRRVRKIVAAGDDLLVLQDVERALLPLLPFEIQEAIDRPKDILDGLPGLLSSHGISEQLTIRLLDAFERQESLVQSLHESGEIT